MDTIAAVSTALAPGGIGIIRISGPKAINIVKKFFKSSDGQDLEKIGGYRAKLGKAFDESGVIDEVIVLIFRAPRSYTGENVAEISCHGGVYIAKKILNLALKNGAKLAKAGEFTKRAFLNGKIDLSKAEAVADLISAQGEKAERLAISGLEGNINKKISEIKSFLIDIVAELSVWADYPEDDIPQAKEFSLKKNLSKVKSELLKISEKEKAIRALNEGLKVSIVGCPNVGKSSLLNLLTGYQRAIVTDIAGTTRDIVDGHTMLGEIPIKLFDTAGIRDSKDAVEKIGVDKAKQYLIDSDLAFVLFDGSRKLTVEDMEVINLVNKDKAIAIINKIDLGICKEISEINKFFKKVVKMSTKKSLGVKDLKNAVYDFINMDSLSTSEPFVSGQRQFDVINRAILAIEEIESAVNSGVTLDAVTVLVQNSIEILGEITGENVSEEIIDKIFSNFCVGK